jgi:cytochrome c2
MLNGFGVLRPPSGHPPAAGRRRYGARSIAVEHGHRAILLLGWAIVACRAQVTTAAETAPVPGGDPARGQAIVTSGAYGCTACHAMPGRRSPQGVVGPPLGGMASRAFIAGQLPNEPEVLVAFLQDPPALVPATGMPDVRLGLDDARHIAAYLYTLEPSDAP